ncbi:MAG TPA: hypothetical protein VMH80_27090 [Bryobacteraceae bacterium]|nr:hypothetical protein [Bryobacteraceae bacterium]
MTKQADRDVERAGLCSTCVNVRRVTSDRGSVFYLCERSKTDARFPKYPRLPVVTCQGYQPNEHTKAASDG